MIQMVEAQTQYSETNSLTDIFVYVKLLPARVRISYRV